MTWPVKPLAELADFTLGKMLDQKKNRGELRPYLANVNVRWGAFDLADLREMRFEASEEERFGLRLGDIVMCEGGEPGRCAIWNDELPGMMVQKALHRIRAKAGIDPRFLYYSFLQLGRSDGFSGLFTGSTIKHLPREKLAKLRLPLPALAEQQRIAGALSDFDELIDNNRKRIALLEDAARLLYREWFVHLRFPGHVHAAGGATPEGWATKSLGDLVELVRDNVLPADFALDDIHIGLEHIPRRSFTLNAWEPAQGLASAKTRFVERDILFAKIRPYFHKVGFALRGGLASSDAIVWRVKNETHWPLVLCAVSSDHFVALASKTVREGSKMPRADWNVLRAYSIPIPPEGLLNVFCDAVRPMVGQCKTLALQSLALQQARDLLLPRLMRGDLAV